MIINETTKSLEEKVYLSLEEAILSGEYKRGDSLTEMSLCKKLGVSRTPVRSALHRLSEEGLIEILPNRGAIVVGMSDDDLADIYKIVPYPVFALIYILGFAIVSFIVY